jgi:glycosyltransferase involved in cell wall biosynthesis
MKVSVIVCTRNQAQSIIGLLETIAQALANAAPLDAEIVVVDGSSSDNTSAVVRKWAAACAFPVRLLFEARKGIAAARSCGIQTAQGVSLYARTG